MQVEFHFSQVECGVLEISQVECGVLEIHFSQLFSNIAYFKACFKVPKIQLPFFHINPYYYSTDQLKFETQLIFKFTRDLVASARTYLG